MEVAEEVLSRNLLLGLLPERSRERLASISKITELREGVTLFHAGDRNDVIFPIDGVVSLLREFADGTMIQVAMIGAEGLVDVNSINRVPVTSYEWIVQSPGLVARLPAEPFMKMLDDDEALQIPLLKYANVRVLHASQLAACNRLHIVTERLAYWLLLLHDRLKSDEMSLTQEFLARMLATRRAGINVAIRELREAGAIEHRRNRVIVADRSILEEQGCDCYEIMLADYKDAFGFLPRPRERKVTSHNL